MIDDDESVEVRTLAVDRLSCGDCKMPLVGYSSAPRVEGARRKLYLVCEGCGKAAHIRARGGDLVWAPVRWGSRRER